MPILDALHPDGSDYDAFLFAELGEDRTGAAVTVLSALARLDLEPWTEARALSCLGQEAAQTRLTAHFKAMADIPGLARALTSEGKAAKLVSLLPKPGPLGVAASGEADAVSVRYLPVPWAKLAVVGVVVLAWIFYLVQSS